VGALCCLGTAGKAPPLTVLSQMNLGPQAKAAVSSVQLVELLAAAQVRDLHHSTAQHSIALQNLHHSTPQHSTDSRDALQPLVRPKGTCVAGHIMDRPRGVRTLVVFKLASNDPERCYIPSVKDCTVIA
jgi:hypothetical protein